MENIDYTKEFEALANRIGAEFNIVNWETNNNQITRILLTKTINNVRISFLAHNQKINVRNGVGAFTTYSGVFVPVYINLNVDLDIMIKFCLDFLKYKFSKRYIKSGFKDFDRRFLVRCNHVATLNTFLKRIKTRELISRLMIKRVGLDKQNVFIEKSNLIEKDCIYFELDRWIYDHKLIDEMLQVSAFLISDLTDYGVIKYPID